MVAANFSKSSKDRNAARAICDAGDLVQRRKSDASSESAECGTKMGPLCSKADFQDSPPGKTFVQTRRCGGGFSRRRCLPPHSLRTWSIPLRRGRVRLRLPANHKRGCTQLEKFTVTHLRGCSENENNQQLRPVLRQSAPVETMALTTADSMRSQKTRPFCRRVSAPDSVITTKQSLIARHSSKNSAASRSPAGERGVALARTSSSTVRHLDKIQSEHIGRSLSFTRSWRISPSQFIASSHRVSSTKTEFVLLNGFELPK